MDLSDLHLKFFPHRARPMAARQLRQGHWDDAFNLADSDEVVSAVMLNKNLMGEDETAQQFKKAITRAGSSCVAPGQLLRRDLRNHRDELQALSEDLPGDEPWTVYRGYNEHWSDPRHGFWTLSKEVANWYATGLDWGGRLVKTEVTKDEVVFYHDEADEQAVIAVLSDDHPIEEIPTFASDFTPLPFTEAMMAD